MHTGQVIPVSERIVDFSPTPSSLQDHGFGDYRHQEKIQSLLSLNPKADWRPTGLNKGLYLDQASRIISAAKDWINEDGAIIDPCTSREQGQSSPRFVSSASILLHFGRHPELQQLTEHCMTQCVTRLNQPSVKANSPDFWPRELATAFMALETVSNASQQEQWRTEFAKVEPEAIYCKVDPAGKNLDKLHNWVVYSSAGESLRECAGLGPVDASAPIWGECFFDKYIPAQINHFTENGMYVDPGAPITYDITTRLQIATALAFGYRGSLKRVCEELLRRGGLTALLFMSPQGYVPYGGRSSQFNFQEMIIAALCELEARRYRHADPQLAGAFKRQARLAALATTRWINDMEPFRHLKNGFPPKNEHGIDSYGRYSVYSLLYASFAGLAAIFADDTIEEAPCPAELGGYTFEIEPPFTKVFANIARTFVQIDYQASQAYDATGLGRFIAGDAPLELGLGMPFTDNSKKYLLLPEALTPSQPTALGPEWQINGEWHQLAGLSEGLQCRFVERCASLTAAEFTVTYQLPDAGLSIEQTYQLTANRLAIDSVITGAETPIQAVGFTVPILVSNGLETSELQQNEQTVEVSLKGSVYRIHLPEDGETILGEETFANRNGVYRLLHLRMPCNRIHVDLELA